MSSQRPTTAAVICFVFQLAVLLQCSPSTALARAGGQWFELPPAYFSLPPEQQLLPAVASLRYPEPEQQRYLGYKEIMAGGVGLTLQRITDNNAGAQHGLHRYSKQQAWNANESIIDIGDRLIDAATLEVIINEVDLSTARSWSNTHPDIFYGIRYVNGTANVLVSYNVRTGEHKNLYTFDQYHQCTFGAGEGNISADEQYVLVSCRRHDNGQIDLLSMNIQSRSLLGTMRASPHYNWASFSQSGEYILVENKSNGSGSAAELIRFSPSFGERNLLSRQRNHGDLGLDENGDDVFVMIDWDYISYIRLKDGMRVNLSVSSPTSTPAGHGHVSCRNVRRPGWCYFSSYERGVVGAVRIAQDGNASTYTDNDGLFVSTGVAEVEIWDHHHSHSGSYRAQPKLTVSPRGTQVIFSSDWYGRYQADDYLLKIVQ